MNNFNIIADATLPDLKIAFPHPFKITYYQNTAELLHALPKNNILLCRSTLIVNETLLKNFHLDFVLTASSGRDHLDEIYLHKRNTNILDAKGANASAVVDYVAACLNVLKSQYAFAAMDIGIIGYGKVGTRLFDHLQTAGYKNIFTYDPFKNSPNSATLPTVLNCDLVCIHPNLHKSQPFPSWHLINKTLLKHRDKNQVIINAARGNIINEEDLLQYYNGIYCTDVYANEPNINPDIIKYATICTPHIAGHTIEAKSDTTRLLSMKLHNILKLPPPIFPAHDRSLFVNYNPLQETALLKQHPSSETFLTLRKNHIRHAPAGLSH